MILDNFYNNLINKYSYHLNDTGSSEIQIILLNFKIKNLKRHILNHKKDYSCMRNLNILYGKMNKLLIYLKKIYPEKYMLIINDLNLK